MGDLFFLLGAAVSSARDSAALIEACLYLPLGVLLSVAVIEVFSGGRKGVDLDKAIVVLLITGSLLFFVSAFLTFSQALSLGQQIAVKSAGAGVLLGLVCAVAAMLKQQCYLQKLLAAARARTRQRSVGGGLWALMYGMVLLITVGGGVAAVWLRPDTLAVASSESDLLVVEDEPEALNSVPVVASKQPEPFPNNVPELAMEEPMPEMEVPTELVKVEPEPEPESVVLEEEPEQVPVVARAKLDPGALAAFNGSVMPMMEGRCVSCHGEDKQKGGLRLDSPSWIREGGHSGPVVVAYNPEKSYIYTSTVLPADDPDIMPAKGKPLTSAQTSAIKRWIRGGAPMGDGKDEEAARAALAANQAKSGGAGGTVVSLSGALADALAEAHIQSKPIEGGFYEIDCSLTRNYPDVKLDLSILDPIADKIQILDLSKTKIKSEGLAPVKNFTNLKKLLLSRTTIDDEALVHLSGLKQLEILNLYGTNVSDDGLDHLRDLSKLQRVFLWNSKATSAGGNRLKQSIPDLEVNVGQ